MTPMDTCRDTCFFRQTLLVISHRAPADRPAAAPSSAPSTFAAPAPDPNRPINGNRPPACTQIPDTAWIAPTAIPLYDHYAWPQLGPLSEPVSRPRFKTDELCAAGPSTDETRDSAIAAHIILPEPPGQWQLQVQIVHWRY